MKRTTLLKFVLGGALLCISPVSPAFGQAPGGGGNAGSGSPGGTPPTLPSQTAPGSVNGPMATNTPDTATSKMDDKKFVKEAALGGMTEVELGKLAAQKAASEDVKQFGQRMVSDHTKADDQLKQIASKENLSLPDALDSKHQARIDKLSKLSGPEFDKAYVKDQLKDHQQDVREFQSEAQTGTDPNVKTFASSTLPTLQEHLTMAKTLNKSEKASK